MACSVLICDGLICDGLICDGLICDGRFAMPAIVHDRDAFGRENAARRATQARI
jgi:hypothetical protein